MKFAGRSKVAAAIIALASMTSGSIAPANAGHRASMASSTRYYTDAELANFDISGIRLRMSPEQVREMLRRNGYTVTKDIAGKSSYAYPICNFQRQVENELRKRQGVLPSICLSFAELQAKSGSGRIAVTFSADNATASGLGVSMIELIFGNVDRATLLNSIVSKYGHPTEVGGFSGKLYWWKGRLSPGFHPSLLYAVPETAFQTEEAGRLRLDGSAWQETIVNLAITAEADRLSPPQKARF